MGEDTEGVDAEGAAGKNAEHEDTAKHHHLSINHPAGLLQCYSV